MRRALVLAGLVGVTFPAFALCQSDSPTSAPGDPAPAEPLATYAEGMVVTASLDEEEADRLPVSVTVIEASEIEARQTTGVAELLRTVPGVAVARSGSPGKVTSLFVRGASSTQTLVLWNGLRLNDPLFGGYDWSFLPTDGVERVEVVRGPFSALWGGDAAGGVVHVLTGRRQGFGLRLEGGEDAYRRAALSTGFGLGGGSFGDGDGEGDLGHLDFTGSLRRGDGQVDNDFYDGDDATARLTLTPRPGLSTGLLARVSDHEIGVPFDFLSEPTPRATNRRESLEVAVPFRLDRTGWEVEASLGRSESDFAARDPDAPSNDRDTDAVTTEARAVYTWRGSSRLWIAGGGEWRDQEATTRSAFSTLEDVDQRNTAAFAQAHWQAARWTVQAGARHDDNDRFGGETSLRLGSVVALGPALRLHGSYGEAFRPPTLSDLFLPFLGNPDLEPERSESWELGLAGESGGWSWGVTGFASDFENLIVFAPPTFQAQNVGRAETHGVEGRIAWSRDRLSARLDTTWLDAENLDTGEELDRRPEESASLVLTWRPAEWTLSLVGRHVGERPDLGVELPSHQVVDLAAAWQARRWLEPYARVENLADEDYEEVAGFPAPGRTLIGGLALTF